MIFARVSIELAHPLIYLMLEIELRSVSEKRYFRFVFESQWETRISLLAIWIAKIREKGIYSK